MAFYLLGGSLNYFSGLLLRLSPKIHMIAAEPNARSLSIIIHFGIPKAIKISLNDF